MSRIVIPLFKKNYKSKTRISKLDKEQCLYESVIPKEFVEHEKYG